MKGRREVSREGRSRVREGVGYEGKAAGSKEREESRKAGKNEGKKRSLQEERL